MSAIELGVVIVCLVAVVGLQVALLLRKVGVDVSPLQQTMAGVEKAFERVSQAVRDESARNRTEAAAAARDSREELSAALKSVGDSLNKHLLDLMQANDQKLAAMRETVEQRLGFLQDENGKKLAEMRQEAAANALKTREEVVAALKTFNESSETRLEKVRATVEEKLKAIQEDNAKSLDQMRNTVEEKLQGTLEKRLGESFKQVSERLEQVHKGLGEMQSLATGVGDLKRVLTNVKTRGTWGEVQLGAMLEEVLTPEQYGKNVATKGDGERVEFAIKLPGRGDDKDAVVWLPIDAKFPIEDYRRLIEAQEQGNAERAEAAGKQLENRIKQCANDVCQKYLCPPRTTDFGILFLPTEGLFFEVMRRVGLAEALQRQCRVTIAGPTTLWSLLNSLQMGFRTLAIEKRSSEVWKLLAAVQTEFGKYGEILDKVQKKLKEASTTIDETAARSRVIQLKLRDVQKLPADQAQTLLTLAPDDTPAPSEDAPDAEE